MVEVQTTGNGEKITDDSFRAKISQWAISQGLMGKLAQQVVSQIGEQDIALLAGETMFPSGFQPQSALVAPKLFDLSRSTVVVEPQIAGF